MKSQRVFLSGLFTAALVSVFCGISFAQKTLTISALQGSKNTSEYDGQPVRVSGIVTARLKAGFFIQTPDDKIDADPLSSEGVYIFTKALPPDDAVPGNFVTVSGRVDEFRPRSADISNLTVTEIMFTAGRDFFAVDSKGNTLPKPITITSADTKPNTFDQFEKYEGMRVTVTEMVTTAPTGGRIDHKTEIVYPDGVFFGVLKGTPRPFREPGMDILSYLASSEREKWKTDFPKLPIFDGNPEVLRVDTSEQVGTHSLNVTRGVSISNVTGVLHYTNSRYTILTDAGLKLTVNSTIRPIPLPQAKDHQFSVASMNIETLVDDVDDPNIKEDVATTEAFKKRIGKISMAISTLIHFPEIIGVIEAENLNVLEKLAERINADAVTAGLADPKYKAFLFDGNDSRGIDCGFLVKTSRVTVISAKQFGKDEKYVNPVTKNEDFLNDRPPIMIEAAIADKSGGAPFKITVVANHLKSLRDIDDPKSGPNTRMKKKLQAEFLARWVNARQKADPTERILLVGDFNAFRFNDGLVDVIGTLIGQPSPKNAVMLASEDLVEPDLINLIDFITPDQRYSFSFDGNSQELDHFIVTTTMKKHLAGFGYLRVNADFPQTYRADGNRPERFSDHDVAVGYFSFSSKNSPK